MCSKPEINANYYQSEKIYLFAIYTPGGGTSQYNEHFRRRERCFFAGERERLRRLLLWASGVRERLLLLRERSRDFRRLPRSRSTNECKSEISKSVQIHETRQSMKNVWHIHNIHSTKPKIASYFNFSQEES